MHSMRIILVLILLLGTEAFALVGGIEKTTGLTRRGLLFTLSATLAGRIHEAADLQQEVIAINDEVRKFHMYASRDRNDPKYYILRKAFNLRANADSKNHLVYIIPGFGADDDAAVARYMIELLTREGYTVVSVDSPPSKRFIKESSFLGIPGIQRLDAEDLYHEFITTKKILEDRRGKGFSKVSLIGASLGGLNASQVLLVDQEKNILKFNRVVSVNPPVSNIYGLNLIDYLVAAAKKRERAAIDSKDETELGVISALKNAYDELLVRKFPFDELQKHAENLVDKSDFTEEEALFLIGLNFSGTVRNAVEGFDERHVDGFADPDTSGLNTFYKFFNVITLPQWAMARKYKTTVPEKYPMDLDVNLDEEIPNVNAKFLTTLRDGTPQSEFLIREDDIHVEMASIRYNAGRLQKPNFTLITFKDDFLLRNDDPQWITNTFDNKVDNAHSKVFAQGGHLGGYYQREFQMYLLQELTR